MISRQYVLIIHVSLKMAMKGIQLHAEYKCHYWFVDAYCITLRIQNSVVKLS
jgi:hypothetical protein